MSAAAWSAGALVESVDGSGTLTASVPVSDGGALAVTVSFTVTSDRALRVDVHTEAGTVLASFEAWSNT